MNEPTPANDLDALMQEQRRCWERGAPTLVEAFLARHPALRGQKDALLDLINHEIVLRSEFDKAPSREEYLARFPDLQADLDLLFEVHKAIEGDSPHASPLAPVLRGEGRRELPLLMERQMRSRRIPIGRRCQTITCWRCSAKAAWGSSTRRWICA